MFILELLFELLLRIFAEILFYGLFYTTGSAFLRVVSRSKISPALPKTKTKKKKKKSKRQSENFSADLTAIIGAVIWGVTLLSAWLIFR